jgi:hypothetical protein
VVLAEVEVDQDQSRTEEVVDKDQSRTEEVVDKDLSRTEEVVEIEEDHHRLKVTSTAIEGHQVTNR